MLLFNHVLVAVGASLAMKIPERSVPTFLAGNILPAVVDRAYIKIVQKRSIKKITHLLPLWLAITAAGIMFKVKLISSFGAGGVFHWFIDFLGSEEAYILPGIKWNLKIYENGDAVREETFSWLFLCLSVFLWVVNR